jgi:hypothetical protein
MPNWEDPGDNLKGPSWWMYALVVFLIIILYVVFG